MSWLDLSALFECLRYGSTAIINTLTVGGSTIDVRIRRLQTSDYDV